MSQALNSRGGSIPVPYGDVPGASTTVMDGSRRAQMSRMTICTPAATGIATSAPRTPSSVDPIRIETITMSGETSTVLR